MIKIIGKLRHSFADPRTGTSFLVKPILGTARLMIILTSLPKKSKLPFPPVIIICTDSHIDIVFHYRREEQ
jgi:hypothetical protein